MRPSIHLATSAAFVLGVLACTAPIHATKPQTLVVGAWHGAPPSAPVGHEVALVLRLTSAADAAQVIVNVLPSDGVAVVTGDRQWTGALSKDQVLDLPFTIKVVANGDWTLGASITNKRPDADQVSGALLRVRARDGIATLSTDAPDHPQR